MTNFFRKRKIFFLSFLLLFVFSSNAFASALSDAQNANNKSVDALNAAIGAKNKAYSDYQNALLASQSADVKANKIKAEQAQQKAEEAFNQYNTALKAANQNTNDPAVIAAKAAWDAAENNARNSTYTTAGNENDPAVIAAKAAYEAAQTAENNARNLTKDTAAKMHEEEAKAQADSNDICSAASFAGAAANTLTAGLLGFKGNLFTVVQCIISYVLYFILWILSLVLAIVGGLFNWVFRYTVVDIKANLDVIKAVPVAWAAVRDLANICFIFILLYLAIATILQLDEHGVKHSLSRLIIAAVLINFSLFFTKVIIDVPNILAIQIYNKVMATAPPKSDLGDVFMNMIVPQAAFKDSKKTEFNGANATGTNAGQNPITTHAMGIIIMIVAIAVFAAVVIIFIKRFVMLIFYMIFSPLAFAGMAIPIHSLEHMAKEKFWLGLIKEAFYAPVFMMCIYITLVVGSGIKEVKILDDASWSILGAANLGVGNIISFSVIMVMLVASLFIAEEMGVKGASGAMSVYKGVTGGAMGAASFIGGATWRNTGGRLAETVWNKKYSDKLLTWSGGIDAQGNKVGFGKKWAARGAVKALQGMSKGYRDVTLAGEKAYTEEAFEEVHMDPKGLAGKAAAAYAEGKYSTQNQAFEQIHHGWSADRHADVMLELERLNQKGEKGAAEALKRLYTGDHRRVDPEMWDRIQTMVKNGRPAHLDEARAADKAGKFNEFLNDKDRTDGQRRFVAMRLKNGEMSPEGVKSLMEIIGKKDSSGMEAVIRDSMTSEAVRVAGQNVLMNARLRNNSVKILSAGGPGAADPEMRKLAYKELFALQDIRKALGGISFDELDKKPGGFDELIKAYKASEHYAEDARGADTAINQKRYVGPTSKAMQEEIELIEKYDTKKK